MSEYKHILSHKHRKLRDRSAIAALKKFFRDSPFLIISIVLHLIILLLLAFITSGEPAEQREERVELKVEEMRFEEVEMQPMITDPERFVTDPAAAGGMAGDDAGTEGESLAEAAEAAGAVEAPRPDIFGMQEVVRGGGEGQWSDRTGPGFAMTAGGGGGLSGAVDEFAVETMNAAARGKTLVVLLIDRTRSVVYLNLPRLVERMDHYFEALEHNLTSEMMENSRWLVVGYGRNVTFHTRPTTELEDVKAALRNIEICPSGEQNIGAALNTILDRYRDYGHRRMLVAAMTDGYGTDLRDGRMIERTIRRMRNNDAGLYVFGHEAAFASTRKRERLRLDPEQLQTEDAAAVRGFEGRTITGWVDAGPESPRRELWRGSRRWGWDDAHMPASGFPMYAMNRMVLATDGLYFLMREESDYDDEKMYARYLPDVCSVREYDSRMREKPLRNALRRVWEELPDLYLTRDFRVFSIGESGPSDHSGNLAEQIRDRRDRAREGRRYATERIRELKELLEEPQVRSMRHYPRWRAHAQVTIAELKRMRFMLGQYGEVLRREWEEHGRRYNFPDFLEVLRHHRDEHGRSYAILELLEEGMSLREAIRELEGYRYDLSIGRGSAPDDFVGPAEAREEYEAARQYARMIIAEHSNTPWELLARRILSNLQPLTCRPRQLSPATQPRPPSLPL